MISLWNYKIFDIYICLGIKYNDNYALVSKWNNIKPIASISSLTTMNSRTEAKASKPKESKQSHHRFVFKRVNKLKYNN